MDSSDRLTELKTLGYIISVGLVGKLECAGWSRCEERGRIHRGNTKERAATSFGTEHKPSSRIE
jgi:hypothetical protein